MAREKYRLVDHGWTTEFREAAKLRVDDLLIISPFIKTAPLRRVVAGKSAVRVLTRFNEQHYLEGVSDVDALTFLLRRNGQVRGIKNLHAKLYVFGPRLAIVTSANLTESALTRNHELGFVTTAPQAIQSCREYFEQLWKNASRVTLSEVRKWERRIQKARRKHQITPTGLRDHGAELGFMPDPPAPSVRPNVVQRGLVKFFGLSSDRANKTMPILHEIGATGCHWALTYPKGRRPRQVQDGDTMFISRMTHSPNDHMIFGRATGYRHVPGRDDASAEDIRRISWKANWPHYIRVRDPEFVAGTMENAVSLNELIEQFGANSFVSTARNRKRGSGNTNPRQALRQKAHIPLTLRAANWLNAAFEEALTKHGRIGVSQLEKFYWPPLPQV